MGMDGGSPAPHTPYTGDKYINLVVLLDIKTETEEGVFKETYAGEPGMGKSRSLGLRVAAKCKGVEKENISSSLHTKPLTHPQRFPLLLLSPYVICILLAICPIVNVGPLMHFPPIRTTGKVLPSSVQSMSSRLIPKAQLLVKAGAEDAIREAFVQHRVDVEGVMMMLGGVVVVVVV